MANDVREIADLALALDDAQRLEVLLKLMASFTGVQDDDAVLSDDLKAELDRRIAHLDANPDDGKPLAEALRQASERLGSRTAE